MKQWFLAAALCTTALQGEFWDSVSTVFGQKQQGNFSDQDKLQMLNSALESNTLTPDFKLVLTVERGNVYLDLGLYQVALNDFSSVIARKPSDKEVLLDALAGQAKAQLALGKTDQYLATRAILMDSAPTSGYPPDSDYYYLVTFPDLYGGPNWWRNPEWRGNFHQWLHDHPHQTHHVIFSGNRVNIIQKPRIPAPPAGQPKPPEPKPPMPPRPEEGGGVGNFERPERRQEGGIGNFERFPERREERPAIRPAAPPANRPALNLPDRSPPNR